MSEASAARVLVIDDEQNIAESIKRALERTGHAVELASTPVEALAALEAGPVDVALCDLRLQGADGMELMRQIRELYPETAVVIITGYGSIESAVAAMKAGATDYLAKPFTPDQLRQVVSRTLEQRRLREENRYLRGEIRHLFGEGTVVGRSTVMQRLFETARTLAASDSSVLIMGESGTGKEVVARFIHAESGRRDLPFVTVNCAAIPANLLESELFGHRRGAFTGATYSRRGSFEVADGGTLFLDEIGDMPLDMQVKILRAIEERRIKRVGSDEPVAVDVRIIAATNRDLDQETRAGRFRDDLYWRLNVVQLTISPLRDRPEDVLPLARHFLAVFGEEMKKPVPDFSPDVADVLERYPWPGNVRELRNTVERAMIFAEAGQPIRLGHLPPQLRADAARARPPGARTYRSLKEIELDYIREVVEACGGNRTRAAEILGLSPVTLWRKLGKEGTQESS